MSKPLRRFLALGAFTLLPTLATTQTTEAAAPTWETTWDAAWARAVQYYAIQAASTVTSDPACQGDLGFHARIKELTRAIQAKKNGDAVRLLGLIQDKSLCLTLEGTRGLEYALAGWVHRSVSQLPPAQAEIAVHGALNAGALVFDELQYTRKSWLMPVLQHYAATLAPMVGRYPKDLGFYAFDWSRGSLVGGVDPSAFVQSMRTFSNYGDGSCSLLDMSQASFICKGWVGKVGGGGGGAGGGGAKGAVGGLPSTPRSASTLSCMIDAAKASGGRGQLGCAAKAVAGMTFDPRTTTPQSLLSGGLAGGQPAIRDPRCALSEDAGNTGPQQDATAKGKEPSAWEQIAAAAKGAADYVKNVVLAVFDKTPPGVAELGQLASAEGADAVRGGLQATQAIKARESLLSGNDDQAGYAYEDARNGRVMTEPQANQRTADRPSPLGGIKGGGSCSRGSNAARRANALYDCISGGTKPPTNRGPHNPVIALVDPGQVQTAPTGALACMQQAGDMPRVSFDDPKCAMTRCAQGALSCPCNGGGGVGGSKLEASGFTPRVTAATSPNCAEPPCGTGATNSGAGPKIPTNTSGGGAAPVGGPSIGGGPKGPPLGGPVGPRMGGQPVGGGQPGLGGRP